MLESMNDEQLLDIWRRDFAFLHMCGKQASRWLSELCSAEPVRARIGIMDAMKALRRYELDTGLTLLKAADHELRSRAVEFQSIDRYVERYRLSALAYYHYMNGNLEGAEVCLSQAHDEIKSLIESHDFLIPLAPHCIDFIIQRARMARREREWKKAAFYIEAVRDIHADRRPYCVLDSGRSIRLSDLRDFYDGLPLTEEQRKSFGKILGEGVAISVRLEQLEVHVFSLPNMVIPYP